MEIKISMERYDELIRAAERIETVKRMFKDSDYVASEDIKIALNIPRKGETNDNN